VLFFCLTLMMLTGMFAFANNGNGDTNNSEPKQVNNQTTAQVSTYEEEDALWCEASNGTITVSCVLCNCAKLAEKLDQLTREAQDKQSGAN